jgi:hypothetical protein
VIVHVHISSIYTFERSRAVFKGADVSCSPFYNFSDPYYYLGLPYTHT